MVLVAGVGAGIFALIFVSVIALIVGLVAAFFMPDKAVLICLGALLLPVLVFAFIMAAPTEDKTKGLVIDHYYIARVIFLILMILGALMGPLIHLGLNVLGASSYEAPDVACRRKKLTAAHSSWVK